MAQIENSRVIPRGVDHTFNKPTEHPTSAMLSRVQDERVFVSSDDVILPSSSHQYLHLSTSQHRLHRPRPNEKMEDEQLHPHHPYRMQKHVLQLKRDRNQQKDRQKGMTFDHQMNYPPMEFVFLSSGEILAREDCPPGLEVPEVQHELGASMNKYLEYHAEENESEEERQSIDSLNRFKRPMKVPTQQDQPVVARHHSEKRASSSSTSSQSKLLRLESVANAPNNDNRVAASNVLQETGEKERAAGQRQSKQAATRGNASHGTGHEHSRTRNEVEEMPASLLKVNYLSFEQVNEQLSPSCNEAPAFNCSDTNHKGTTSSSEGTAQKEKRRPRSLHQRLRMSKVEKSNDFPTRRSKRSPKMEVGHLETETLSLHEEDQTLSKDKKRENELASELQREKERVLEKMTQLLDEQGKNQQLRDRIDALEAQLAAKDCPPSNATQELTHEKEVQKQLHEEKQVYQTSALRDPSRQDEDQIKVESKPLQKATNDADQSLVGSETDEIKTEPHNMDQLVHKFIASIKRWKDSTTEEMQSCDDNADMLALFELKWLSFPQFPKKLAEGSQPSAISDLCQKATPGDEELADAVIVLKKRLRQREDELRQIHGNYVDLKEMCARQCVRESVLQKFINEHRLRGNLIIRKHSGNEPTATGKNQESLPDDQEERAKLTMISRGTNTSAGLNEDDDYFINDEDVNNQEDDDDYNSAKDEYSVRTPQIFVQVGRDGVYERAESAVAQKLAFERRGKQSTHFKQPRAERVRLIPSSSLSQRHERVPTPTATTARRKKPLQQHKLPRSSASRSYLEMGGKCPPGCGSRSSSMRRKMPTAVRPKVSQRPMSATSTRGAIGVVRPWM